MTPDLEAHGPYVVARRGDTTQQVADCSVSPHGEAYARLFAGTQRVIKALEGMLEVYGVRACHLTGGSQTSAAEVELCNEARAAIAAATGKGGPS
jgi:hypothetical protein